MSFKHHRVLNFSCVDSKGTRPDRSMIGKSYFHPKTRRLYRVNAFVWNSSTDEWDVKYNRQGCDVEFTRRIAEFNDGRFIEVDNTDLGEEDY